MKEPKVVARAILWGIKTFKQNALAFNQNIIKIKVGELLWI